jgi:nucleotide-binding universal stress UspA family protein
MGILWRGKKMYKKILLPTDGSDNAARAFKHAMWIADVSGADILVLYVVELFYPSLPSMPSFRESLYHELRTEGKRIVEEFKKNLEEIKGEGMYKNLNLTTQIKEGKPYDVIIKTIVNGVDLVVMGASGRHGLDRFMLGSVTERVVREATCPVLVVH